MRLIGVRFRVRSVMIVVIIFSIALGGIRWVMETKKRAAMYRRLSDGYEVSEYLYSDPAHGPPDPVDRDKLVRHIAGLRAKYEYAAAHPWESVVPDPPEPIEATKWGIKVTTVPGEDRVPVSVGYSHPPRF